MLDGQVEPVQQVLQQHIRREVDAGGLRVGEQRFVHRTATGFPGRCLSADLLKRPHWHPGLQWAARSLCAIKLAEDDRSAPGLAFSRGRASAVLSERFL